MLALPGPNDNSVAHANGSTTVIPTAPFGVRRGFVVLGLTGDAIRELGVPNRSKEGATEDRSCYSFGSGQPPADPYRGRNPKEVTKKVIVPFSFMNPSEARGLSTVH